MSIRDNYKKIIMTTYYQILDLRNLGAKDEFDEYAQIPRDRQLFKFGGDDASYYKYILENSEELSKTMVFNVISYILYSKRAPIKSYSDNDVLRIVVQEGPNCILYFFKDFGVNNFLPQNQIDQLIKQHAADNYMYVSFVWDHAYMERLNHNDNERDPSRGGKSIGISDFMRRFLHPEELKIFKNDIEEYSNKVNEAIGMNIVKSLNPIALYKFRKRTAVTIRQFNYKKLLSNISVDYHKIIEEQFFGNKLYMALVSNTDFAESFITAEWLFQAFENEGKIDYTVVAMGYFKAIEQLLYCYILLHKEGQKDKKRYLRRKHWHKDSKYTEIRKRKDGTTIHDKSGNPKLFRMDPVVINEENVSEGRIDTSLGPMIKSFFCNSENDDLIRKTNDDQACVDVIYEVLRGVNPLRNGYFHKDNLDEWERVIEARNLAFEISYIILGAFIIDEKDYEALGVSKEKEDYYNLCEYILNHPKKIYYMAIDGTEEQPFRCRVTTRFSKLGECSFGEIHLYGIRKKEYFKLTEDSLPNKIEAASKNFFNAIENGELSFEKFINGERVLIYNGSFCAPEIEEDIQY